MSIRQYHAEFWNSRRFKLERKSWDHQHVANIKAMRLDKITKGMSPGGKGGGRAGRHQHLKIMNSGRLQHLEDRSQPESQWGQRGNSIDRHTRGLSNWVSSVGQRMCQALLVDGWILRNGTGLHMIFTGGLDKSCKLASERLGEQLNSKSITSSIQGLSCRGKEQRKASTGS